ncbi:MAG TPA: HD-GYP domain-containing protein [Negativicutes bacterium]|nr:HD-GYP domain-containing protein [Negativicutes bacterium]
MIRVVTKRYQIGDVKPGMEIAGSLIADNDKFALGEGTVLTANLIERLKGWGVEVIDIRQVIDSAEKEAPPLTEKQEAVSTDYNDTVVTLKRSFETIRFFKQVPLKEMRELADSALEPFINTSGILNHLQIVRRQDDYTFHHSIDVAVLCGVVGRWLGYRGEELKDMVLAGLLHDIGKTQIPLEILRKPGKLTPIEMDVMRLHTTRGFNLIKELDLPASVTYAILQHHEREDGSGYPLQVTGEKIHPFAKVVAVVDIYDAMTSDKVYSKKTTPFVAVEALMRDMYDKLDPNICTVFLNNVRDYFIGNIILLSDGREAEVVYLGKFISARPVVRTDDGEFIDLEHKKDLSIIKVVRT